MKRLLLTLIIILTSSQAYPLVFYKVSPDYEISVSMSVVVVDTTPITTKWHINVKVRDMLTKKYIKAWDKTTSDPADFDRSGSRELAAFTKDYDGYDLAYKVMIESVFKIAMQIQDAGLIPVIKYGKIDQIDNAGGTMFHRTGEQPSGTWSSKRRYTYVKTYFPDYYISAAISPVMSDDKKTVLSWITTFQIYGSIGHEMSIWKESETDILNFDITEPDTHTKDTFTIASATWLDAQKAMFVKTHLIISKIVKSQTDILVEARFGDINFTNGDNVMLIDLRNGILPDGNMIEYVSTLPSSPETISPANGVTLNSTPVLFSWVAAANATSYKLTYWDSTVYKPNPVKTNVTVSGTSTQITLPISTTEKWYTWYVVGINDDGEGVYLGDQYFTIKQ